MTQQFHCYPRETHKWTQPTTFVEATFASAKYWNDHQWESG